MHVVQEGEHGGHDPRVSIGTGRDLLRRGWVVTDCHKVMIVWRLNVEQEERPLFWISKRLQTVLFVLRGRNKVATVVPQAKVFEYDTQSVKT